jgi:acetyltransferase-like isoleucine patch superfamily enzyme
VLHESRGHRVAQASRWNLETRPNGDAAAALLENAQRIEVINTLTTMGYKSTEYRAASLWRKFWTRSPYERWSYVWHVVRGLLRAHQIDSPHLVLMGRGVVINKHNGRFTTGGICLLRPGCRIGIVGKRNQPAHLHIGEGTEIGDRTLINVSQRIEIGARCSISWDCEIGDTDFHQIILADGQRPPVTEPVIIEDDVWIGSRCLILKSVTIGHHSVVAAGSVVRRDMPPYSLVAGNPARRVSQVAGWQR